MIGSHSKYYIIYSYINNNGDIYSPTMPYKWKWANGPPKTLLPLGIFDNFEDVTKLKSLLLDTYPAKSKKATIVIRDNNPFYCLNLINIYNIKKNMFYLQSFFIDKSESYSIHELINLFNNDILS